MAVFTFASMPDCKQFADGVSIRALAVRLIDGGCERMQCAEDAMSCLSMNIRIRKARFGSYAHQPVAGLLANTAERVKVSCPPGDAVHRDEPYSGDKAETWLRLLESARAHVMTLVRCTQQ